MQIAPLDLKAQRFRIDLEITGVPECRLQNSSDTAMSSKMTGSACLVNSYSTISELSRLDMIMCHGFSNGDCTSGSPGSHHGSPAEFAVMLNGNPDPTPMFPQEGKCHFEKGQLKGGYQ